MPEVLPFSAWKYNKNLVKIEDVVAPPYDVVSEEEIQYFKKKSPYNIFHLELPESYQKASELLNLWIKNRVILNSEEPAVYLYELEFEFSGKKFFRRGFIALVELSDFEQGKIVPHEKVFPKVTEDRLNLLKATGFQFSQIFGLYEDERLELFSIIPSKKLLFKVNFNSQTHILYEIKDHQFFKNFTEFFRDKRIFIADGHHRYTTALKYKEYMQKKHSSERLKDFNFTAMYLCAIEDPNLLMLPTHRVYRVDSAQEFIEKFKKLAEVKKTVSPDRIPSTELSESEWIFVSGGEAYIFSIKGEIFKKIMEKDSLLAKLPVYNFLEVFKEIFNTGEEEFKEKGKVVFLSSIEKVLTEVRKGGVGVIFPGVSPIVLKEVALAGKRMPHKSTYFYPKILTGMLLNEVSGKDLRVF